MVARTPVAFAAVLALAGCAADLTQIVVVFETDFEVPIEMDELHVRVVGADPMQPFESTFSLTRPDALPATLGLVRRSDEAREVTITTTARIGPIDLVSRTDVAPFVEGETRVLRIVIARSCVTGVVCPSEAPTCTPGGVCRASHVDATDLVPFSDDAIGARAIGFGEAIAPALVTLPESSGATYHVDPSSGDDAASGAAGAPWRTLVHALDGRAPGDIVLLAPGPYSPVGPALVQGEPSAPITIAPEPGRVVVLPNLLLGHGSAYVRVTGLVFDGALGHTDVLLGVLDSSDDGTVTHDIELSWNEVRGSRSHGIRIQGSRHRVLYNHVHHNGSNPDTDGIRANGQSIVIAGNVIHDNLGRGVGSYPAMDGATIAGNTIVGNGVSGMSLLGGAAGILIVNNIIAIHTNLIDMTASGQGVALGDGIGPGNAVRKNLFDQNARHDVRPDAAPGTYVADDNLSELPLFTLPGPASPPEGATTAPATERDLRCMPGSPAIDVGLAPWGLPLDADRALRPRGEGLDLGAYEVP